MTTRKSPFPAEVLLHHTAVIGKTGSGKTSTTKLLVEHVVSTGARVCVLDTVKSDWWGITSSADGKRPGLPFQILGGPRGHVPLPSSAGTAIGELVANGALPLSIIDMADFEAGGTQKFFVDFASTLFRKTSGVVYLVIEEAHELAPKERVGFGAETQSIHWAKKLATASRTKGIRLVVATQRTQSLHNAVLDSCETVIVHRITTEANQKPVLGWLKANAKAILPEVADSLASLKTGTGWLCSGEARVFSKIEFPRIATYDNTKTPTGNNQKHNVKMAPVDLNRLRAIIGQAVQVAEENDPATLKRKIAALQNKLASQGNSAPASNSADVARAERAAEARGRAQGFDDGKRVGEAEGYRLALKETQAALAALKPRDHSLTALPERKRSPSATTPTPSAPAIPTGQNVPEGERLPPGEQAVLIVCAQTSAGATRQQITIVTGYKQTSRNEYIRRLKHRGYIDHNGDRLIATPHGIAALGAHYEPAPTGGALLPHVLERLPQGERQLLEVLVSRWPDIVDRTDLEAATGYKKTSCNEYIRRLLARELVEKAGAGAVRAAANLLDQAA